jgi:dynein heavy chain
MTLGSQEVPYDKNFRLLLQTKLSNPHYKPEIAAQCTIVNCIVTETGLEEQLLALVVDKEKPELEEKRTALVVRIVLSLVNLILLCCFYMCFLYAQTRSLTLFSLSHSYTARHQRLHGVVD